MEWTGMSVLFADTDEDDDKSVALMRKKLDTNWVPKVLSEN